MASITDYYAEPWSAWDLNLRDFYHPQLIMSFMERSYLSQMVPLRVDPSAMGAKKLIWTGIYPLEPNWNQIDDVSWWLDKMSPTGYTVDVEMETYGGGMGLSAAPSRTKAVMEKLSLITGKAQAWVTRGKQALRRAAAETERESTLQGDATVRTLAYVGV